MFCKEYNCKLPELACAIRFEKSKDRNEMQYLKCRECNTGRESSEKNSAEIKKRMTEKKTEYKRPVQKKPAAVTEVCTEEKPAAVTEEHPEKPAAVTEKQAETTGSPDVKSVKRKKKQRRASVVIELGNYPELYESLESDAAKNLRTLPQQVLWILLNQI